MTNNFAPKALIYVQHLLGIGHLQRALSLAEAIRNTGIGVDIVSGGRETNKPLPKGVNFHQLPSTHCADAQFDQLLDDNNLPITDLWKQKRCEKLIGLYKSINPDILITETYPFGRRMMRFELLPLLKLAKQFSESTHNN